MVKVSGTLSVKILRQKHNVTFNPGESVKAIVEALAALPQEAAVYEVAVHDDGSATIVFHEEKVVS